MLREFVGQKIKTARKELGFTQQEVADFFHNFTIV